jgi:hypothetical protein
MLGTETHGETSFWVKENHCTVDISFDDGDEIFALLLFDPTCTDHGASAPLTPPLLWLCLRNIKVQTLTQYFCKIYFNNIIPSTLRFPASSVIFISQPTFCHCSTSLLSCVPRSPQCDSGLQITILYAFLNYSIIVSCFTHCNHVDLVTCRIFDKEQKLFSICSSLNTFLQPSGTACL